MAYHLTQEGREVQIDLNKIEDIHDATQEKAGLMSATDKAKLDGVESGAQVNVNADWNAASGDAQILNRPTIPTKVSQLTNDSGFITVTVTNLVNYYKKTETYNRAEIAALIGAIQKFHYEIYASLEDVTRPATNVLYLIGPKGTGTDKYEEYVYDPSKQDPFVKIGDTSIDLSNYVTTEALNTALADYTTTANLTTLLAGKQDKIDADHKLSYTLLTDTPTIPDAQIQSDWNQSDDTKKDFIKNKPTIPTVTGKADKVSGAVNGNFAALDSNGNLTDSGHKHSDYLTSFTETDPIFSASAASGIASSDITAWNGKYTKPSGGIPASDLASGVIPDITGKQDTANLVTSWQSTPDDTHYPSEKLVKDSLDAKQPTIDSSHKLDYGLLSNTPSIPDAVEPNPTVPAGTTPTSLTGLKIGSGYYDIDAGGGTVTDVTVGGTSVVSDGVAVIPAIPTVEALTSNEIDTLWANN